MNNIQFKIDNTNTMFQLQQDINGNKYDAVVYNGRLIIKQDNNRIDLAPYFGDPRLQNSNLVIQ